MRAVLGTNNRSTEQRLVRIFRTHTIIGWRRGSKLPGKPDFVFLKLKLAVFVDGCFWHGCPLHGTQPKNNAAFWRKKISTNQARDRLVNRTLRSLGWRVLRIWEHELSRKNERRLRSRLARALAVGR